MERLGRTSSRGRTGDAARNGPVTEWWRRAEHRPIGYDMMLAGLGSFLGASVCLACATILLFLQPV